MLTEFCQENPLVIAYTLVQQQKRQLYTWTSSDGQYWNQTDYILCSWSWRSSIQSAETRLGADYGSDHELLLLTAAKSLQSCPTLCDPRDGIPSGSPVPGILQARTLEWAAISFSNAWKWKVKVKLLSHVWLCATPKTAGSPPGSPPLGFCRQEHWNGLPFPSPMHESEKWKWSRSVVSDS